MHLLDFMHSIESKLDKVASAVASITFACMSILVITQVISRCFLSHSFQFAEEMARYFFIWSTMLAAACATYSHLHIGVDILVSYMKGKLQFSVKLIAQLMFMCAVAILTYYGWEQTLETISSGQTATSFPVSAGLLYLSIPVSGVLMLFYTTTQLFELIMCGNYKEKQIQDLIEKR